MAQELKSTPATAARAMVLALVAGYIDAYSLVNYKVFASFMSGNTTTGGSQLGLANLSEAARNLLPIPLFIFGIFAGALMLHSEMRHRLARLLMLVAARSGHCHGSPIARHAARLVQCERAQLRDGRDEQHHHSRGRSR